MPNEMNRHFPGHHDSRLNLFFSLWVCWVVWCFASHAASPVFSFPTDNTALLDPSGGDRFYVGTTGKSWPSGTFGCVRSDGLQIHEGLDIRCLTRDAKGEPTDAVRAAARGVVTYISTRESLSNYGKYLVLRHRIESIEVFTLYAHLSAIRSDLRAGTTVARGETIATMGRTANTSEPISKERAHLHFEINLKVNDRFADWLAVSSPGERNDHGAWNGRNLLGLDPAAIYLGQHEQGNDFSLLRFVRNQAELCRLVVREVEFPWTRRYRPLILRNPVADREGIAGYEMALNFNGIPFQLIPKAASELSSPERIQLLGVNEPEQQARPCRKLVVKEAGRWRLTQTGRQLVELLIF